MHAENPVLSHQPEQHAHEHAELVAGAPRLPLGQGEELVAAELVAWDAPAEAIDVNAEGVGVRKARLEDDHGEHVRRAEEVEGPGGSTRD